MNIIFISVTSDSSTIMLRTIEEIQAISSPNYPNDLIFPPHGMEIRIIIQSPEGSFLELILLEFDFQPYCFDPLHIYDGELYPIYNPIQKHKE